MALEERRWFRVEGGFRAFAAGVAASQDRDCHQHQHPDEVGRFGGLEAGESYYQHVTLNSYTRKRPQMT